MKHKNSIPGYGFPLQGLLVYTLVFLFAISLSSFIQHFPDNKAAYAANPKLMKQFQATKKYGNQVVGVASMALGLVVITLSAGLAVNGRRQSKFRRQQFNIW